MKRVKFSTSRSRPTPGVRKFADTSFDFGFNVTKKAKKGTGKKKAPAGGGS